jgi:formylglycine-generating enzyme required for sulfatase activity
LRSELHCYGFILLLLSAAPLIAQPLAQKSIATAAPLNFAAVRSAIADLTATFGPRYPYGAGFLGGLDELEHASALPGGEREHRFRALQREALLANPLLDFDRLLVVRRRMPVTKNPMSAPAMMALGLPSNHECNSSLDRTGYDNELAVLSLAASREHPRAATAGALQTLHRPAAGGYVGEVDLHWDGDRFLFTQANTTNWTVWELRADGSGLRPVSQMPDDVDAFDACYLPNGKIVFGTTAAFASVPCWHGKRRVSNLYLMNADGSGVRQLCLDQDHDLHPAVLPNGQVLFNRWDYTGISHIYLRELMVMNPDGTGQRAIFGSNSWYPNSLYFAQPLPGDSRQLISVLSGYHGVHKMGQLVRIDTSRGGQEADGLVQRLSGRGDPIRPQISDILVNQDWPKFLHPLPLSDRHFLVAAWPAPGRPWGIYLADTFDNLVLIREEPGYALLEPVPLQARPRPPVIPERVDPSRPDASVYLQDIYAGPGLEGVPRGTVKSLRVLAYHFGYPGLAGPDIIGRGGPWEVMRILGTVPLEADGSAHFSVPANTPLAVQPLDAEGKAVQLMRSWFTAMPGERVSCVGCHEGPATVPAPTHSLAAKQAPRAITEWFGPARGFDFEREVQPVLDAHCVRCHDGSTAAPIDLRPADQVRGYAGRRLSKLAIERMPPEMKAATGGLLKYTPAYDALLPYVRRVGIEDDVSLLAPGLYHADTSPLVQLLKKGHHDTALDAEAWSRLVTWIDLNAPCHGTWGEAFPLPEGIHARRMALRQQFGGQADDPEKVVHPTSRIRAPATIPGAPPASGATARAEPVSNFKSQISDLSTRAGAAAFREQEVDLGGGVTLKLVPVAAGEFLMGDANGQPDERPLARVAITQPFWMGAFEVTNEQFRRFNASFDARYYGKRHARPDDQGLPLNAPRQPAIGVSWHDAMAFCQWLSQRTGRRFTLPTEAQWEWACRAGNAAPLAFGGVDADFSPWANLADASFRAGLMEDGNRQQSGGLEHLMLDGADLSDARGNDRAIVTAPVGSFRANAWGLFDLHGNAAEWTRSECRPYPYRDDDGRNAVATGGRRVVRGGSFFDPPPRSRSAGRLDYPAWQRVFNVGFRVVCEIDPPATAAANGHGTANVR